MPRLLQAATTLIMGVALLFPSLTMAQNSLSDVRCLCVGYLRQVLGINVRGDANTIQPNASIATVVEGDVLLFYYPTTRVHHAAVVTHVKDGYLTISESNYRACTPTTRTIHYLDPTIKGIYRPVVPTF